MTDIIIMIIDDEVDNKRHWVPVVKYLKGLGAKVIPRKINQMLASAIAGAPADELLADLYVCDIRNDLGGKTATYTGNSVAHDIYNRFPCSIFVVASSSINPAGPKDRSAIVTRAGKRVICDDENTLNAINTIPFYDCLPKYQKFAEEEGIDGKPSDKKSDLATMGSRLENVCKLLEPIQGFERNVVHVVPLLKPQIRPKEVTRIIEKYLRNTGCPAWVDRHAGSSLAFARGGRIKSLAKQTSGFLDMMVHRVLSTEAYRLSTEASLASGPIEGWKSLSVRFGPKRLDATPGMRQEAATYDFPLDHVHSVASEKAGRKIASMYTYVPEDLCRFDALLPGIDKHDSGKCFQFEKRGRESNQYRLSFEASFPALVIHFPPENEDLKDWPLLYAWKGFEAKESK